MSKVKIEGVVHAVGETQSFGAKGFRKRDVVVEVDNGKFTNLFPIEFTGELADTSASLKVDEHIVVDGYLAGRAWQKDPSQPVKYFLSIKAGSFAVNGQNIVQEPSLVPASKFDDDIPF